MTQQEIASLRLTPTEARMLETLLDGRPHLSSDMRKCLCDDLATTEAVYPHLCNLRKKLRTVGKQILTMSSGSGVKYYKYLNGESLWIGPVP